MKKLFLILFFLVILSGCAVKSSFVPAQGLLYSHTKAPLSTSFYKVDVSKISGQAEAYYVGYSILGYSYGDVSITETMKNGKLEQAYYADYELTSIFSVYHKLTVRTFGAPNKT